MEDHYEILGLTPTASESDIEDAFQLWVQLSESGTDEDGELVRLIEEAYLVLSDPTRRRQYDIARLANYRKPTFLDPWGFDERQRRVEQGRLEEQAQEALREQERQRAEAEAAREAKQRWAEAKPERLRQLKEDRDRARSERERKEKEPLLMDLATNVRSLLLLRQAADLAPPAPSRPPPQRPRKVPSWFGRLVAIAVSVLAIRSCVR